MKVGNHTPELTAEALEKINKEVKDITFKDSTQLGFDTDSIAGEREGEEDGLQISIYIPNPNKGILFYTIDINIDGEFEGDYIVDDLADVIDLLNARFSVMWSGYTYPEDKLEPALVGIEHFNDKLGYGDEYREMFKSMQVNQVHNELSGVNGILVARVL